ncbi:MAG: Ig-like domain-containing protein [Paludibacteraceae bacterium]
MGWPVKLRRKNPTTATNNTEAGKIAWTSSTLTNIITDNGAMVTATLAANEISNNLDITGFDLSAIPALSQIVGINVIVNRNAGIASRVLDNTIQLLNNGVAVGDNKATTTTWPTTSDGENATYGGATDTWGRTWSVAELSTLGLRIQAKRNTTAGNIAANVDNVRVTVYYSSFGDDQSSVAFTVSGVTGATGYTWTVPTGGTTITSGQGTENIFVNFNNASQLGTYDVCVTPKDACGNGTQICKSIAITNNTNNEISGTVYNDPNGSISPEKVDGTPVSTVGGQQLYAILTTNSDSKALSSTAIASDGTYKFSYLTSTTANYYRIYINTKPFGDASVVSAGLPAGAVFNGTIDNNDTNSLTGGSSTNGYITVTAGNNTNNTNVNFGIKINNPVANNDDAIINEDAVATINVLTNDAPVSPATINASSVDLDPNTSGIQNTLNTSNGSWSVNSSGVVTFTPIADYYGKDSINYTINDSNGYLSNPAKIVVTVNPVNDVPSFTKGANQTVNEDSGPITVNGWATNIK